MRLGTPDQLEKIFQNDRSAQRCDHPREGRSAGADKRRHRDSLLQEADEPDGEDHRHHGHENVPVMRDRQRVGDETSESQEVALREVKDPGRGVHEVVRQRDEGVHAPDSDAGEQRGEVPIH